MSKDASLATRVVYCIVVLGAVLPAGLFTSGWVAMTLGASTVGAVPFIGPILLFAIGLYRIYVVARSASTLATPTTTGGIAFVRNAGLVLLYLGAVTTVLGWVSGPIMHALINVRSESGVEFYMAGLVVAVLAKIGVLGLIRFEFSRLRSFETRQLQAG